MDESSVTSVMRLSLRAVPNIPTAPGEERPESPTELGDMEPAEELEGKWGRATKDGDPVYPPGEPELKGG